MRPDYKKYCKCCREITYHHIRKQSQRKGYKLACDMCLISHPSWLSFTRLQLLKTSEVKA